LASGELFRKIVSALSELVEQGNFMVDGNMISFQGMDSSHVSLVSLQLTESGFEQYRCDSDQCLGIQFSALSKILKCMTSKDSLSIQAQSDGDVVNFIFESMDQKRYSNFELKLNDIDQEQLGIPDTEYDTIIEMPSAEFQRICRDLAAIGDTVTISATKQGVKFSVDGDIGSGDMTIKGMMDSNSAPNQKAKVKAEPNGMEEDEDEDMMMGSGSGMGGNVDDDDEADSGGMSGVKISLSDSVQQTFSLRYLNNFTKATGLSPQVILRMGTEVPLEVEYKIGDQNFGAIRYYLAPKIDDDE
jgi:proliferating cell nuclear antigen